MACPLLRLALPLALALTVPALQVAIDRVALSYSAGPAAVGPHAIILSGWTVVYLILNGPNVYAVVAVARLQRTDRVAAIRYVRDVYLLAFGLALLSLALYPFAGELVTPLLGRAPEPTEVVFAEHLSEVVSFLLIQNAALVFSLASARVRPAIIATGVGLLVHAALTVSSLPGLTLSDAGSARCWGAAASAVFASFFYRAGTKHLPPTMPSGRTMLEALRGGAVVGASTVLGFLSVGIVFFLAMKRCGAAPLAAAGLSFGCYALFATFPLAIAQATGILTARARSPAEIRKVVTSGVRLAAVLSFTIALGLSAFSALNHRGNGQAELSLALLGTAAFATLDGPGQAYASALRGMNEQGLVLQAPLGTGILYTATLFSFSGPEVRWAALVLYAACFLVAVRTLFLRLISQRHQVPGKRFVACNSCAASVERD